MHFPLDGQDGIYALNYLNGAAIIDYSASGTLATVDRYQIYPGGGYPYKCRF
jgi:hypothetical protein